MGIIFSPKEEYELHFLEIGWRAFGNRSETPPYCPYTWKTIHPFSSSGPFLCGASWSDRRGKDEEGSYGQQVRRQRRDPEEHGGGGQESWTHPFLCRTIHKHMHSNTREDTAEYTCTVVNAWTHTQAQAHYLLQDCFSLCLLFGMHNPVQSRALTVEIPVAKVQRRT